MKPGEQKGAGQEDAVQLNFAKTTLEPKRVIVS
jgi:hypothetical protein